ncbi:unnamed protein product [Rotaria socialis]
MVFVHRIHFWLVLLINASRITAISFNRPQFCSNTTWNPIGITFADSNTIGKKPYGMFVNINNTDYVPNRQNSIINVWLEGNSPPIIYNIINSGAYSIFVTSDEDFYFSYGGGGVNEVILNNATTLSTVYFNGACWNIFIDTNNSLYCALSSQHQVIKRSLNSSNNNLSVVAGTGCPGFLPYMLYSPSGIFVDINFNLYVADSDNDRIQLFQPGNLNGTTVAGNGAPGTIELSYPVNVVLDAAGYLFIVDCQNNRIVGSGPNGFLCIVGCSGGWGSRSDQLFYPYSMAFDSYGNIYVADTYNNRIQKFYVSGNFCNLSTTTNTMGNITTTLQINSLLTTTPSIGNVALRSNQLNVSLNQPRFCALATWSPDGITIADSSEIGPNAISLFITTNNTIYVVEPSYNNIQVLLADNGNLLGTISGGVQNPYSIFITSAGDIYTDSTAETGQINKLLLNTNNNIPVMYITGNCFDLFIDINSTIYCSAGGLNIVVAKSLYDSLNTSTVVAGTGCSGSLINMLDSPTGIFVDINFNLYVADSNNNRIQLFQPGNLNGTTLAGQGAPETIMLNNPTDVVLDGDGYLFIVDSGNNRIVGSGPNGFRCIVGCSGASGSGPTQLNGPQSIAFDSDGNIYVTDTQNSRLQKFNPSPLSCIISYNEPKICPTALWNPNAAIFADNTMVGIQPTNIFVDAIDGVYVSSPSLNLIRVWSTESMIPTRNLSGNLNDASGIFVIVNGDMYASSGILGDVYRWRVNATNSVLVMNTLWTCFSLFIDINNTLYCSVESQHLVLDFSLNITSNAPTIAAGNGSNGSTSNMLNKPQGIFVDIDFSLYVADCNNDRVQKFNFGKLNGTTVFGNGMFGANTVSCPSGVVIDADGNLFIVDKNNHRIVRSGPIGFQCIVGCTGSYGPALDQLYFPVTMAFDSVGNILVADTNNDRILTFLLDLSYCDTPTTGAMQTTIQLLGEEFSTMQWQSSTVTGLISSRPVIITVAPRTVATTPPATITIPVNNSTTHAASISANNTTIPMTTISANNTTIPMTTIPANNATMHTTDIPPNISTTPMTTLPAGNATIPVNNTVTPTSAIPANNTIMPMTTLTAGNATTAMTTIPANNATMHMTGIPANNTIMPMTTLPAGNATIPVNNTVTPTSATPANNTIMPVTTLPAGNATIPVNNTVTPTSAIPANNTIMSMTTLPAGNATILVNNTVTPTSAIPANNTIMPMTTLTAGNATTAMTTIPANNATMHMTGIPANNTIMPMTTLPAGNATIPVNNTVTPTSATPANNTIMPVTTLPASNATIPVNNTVTPTSATPANNTIMPVTTLPAGNATIPVNNTVTPTSAIPANNSTTATTTIPSNNATTTTITMITSTISTTTMPVTNTTTPGSSSSTRTSISSYKNCYQPIITLTPANSSLSSPLQYRRSEAFSISSYIQLNCSGSLSNTIEWKISHCTSTICSSETLQEQTIITTLSELYIPELTLDYGTYQFTLTVRMFAARQLSSAASAYIQIIPSNIVVNLVQFGPTMITRGYQQDLILDPGSYSIDPDTITFNASNWNYEYYCRIYPDYSFPSILGTDLPLDDPRTQQFNSSCFSNQSGLNYVGATNSPKSSLIILGNSLKSSQTYQFKVTMLNLQNSSVQGFDYLLVKVERNQQMLIVMGCVISTLCGENVEYQYVNPTTQVALFSTCTDNCQSINNITWNIYQGVMNTTSNVVQWTAFQNVKQYENIWFFGNFLTILI